MIERARPAGAAAVVCIGESLDAARRARGAGRALTPASLSHRRHPPARRRRLRRRARRRRASGAARRRRRRDRRVRPRLSLRQRAARRSNARRSARSSPSPRAAAPGGRPHARRRGRHARHDARGRRAPACAACSTATPGARRLAEHALAVGWYVSFSGIVTFKKWTDDELLRLVPDDRLLVESDAPYLAPVPHRGKRNEPAWVPFTARARRRGARCRRCRDRRAHRGERAPALPVGVAPSGR